MDEFKAASRDGFDLEKRRKCPILCPSLPLELSRQPCVVMTMGGKWDWGKTPPHPSRGRRVRLSFLNKRTKLIQVLTWEKSR